MQRESLVSLLPCISRRFPASLALASFLLLEEVEDEIEAMNTELGDLKLVVRNGKTCAPDRNSVRPPQKRGGRFGLSFFVLFFSPVAQPRLKGAPFSG